MMNSHAKNLRGLAEYSGFKPHISKMLQDAADELDKIASDKKWYVRCDSGKDDEGYAVVELTQTEYETVRKFLAAPVCYGGGWTGYSSISEGYSSEEEAKQAIIDDSIVWARRGE